MKERSGFLDQQIEKMFHEAQARFGKTVRSCWLNDAPGCPGCGGEIDLVKVKGGEAISLNAYMYRQASVLIGYLLCAACASKLFKALGRNPFNPIGLHTEIERNLESAYRAYLRRLKAQ